MNTFIFRKVLMNKNLSLLLTAFLLSSMGMQAQTVNQVIIGNTSGPSSYFYGPVFRNNGNAGLVNYSRYAYLYTAAELGIPSGSKIIKVEWMKKDTARILGNNNFAVWISNTSSTSYPVSAIWSSLVSSATQVFNSTTYSITTGANTYIEAPFTDSFTYYGGSLQILTDWAKLGFATAAIPFYTVGSPGRTIGTATTTALNGNSTLQTATYGGSHPTIRITYVTVPPCTGTPNPGNTVSSNANICAGNSFTLSLQNSVQGGLISYQWQSASDASFTTNFQSNLGNGSSLNTTQTVNTYYRCIVTCASSGASAISTPLLVPMSPSYGCYCSCRSISDADEDIFKFTFSNLKNCSNCSSVASGAGSIQNIYSNYQYITPASVQKNSDVPFSIEIGVCGVNNYANRCAIYIDFNQNMSFADAGELVYSSPIAIAGAHTEIGSINIPGNALTGLTGMRVINVEQSGAITSPCLTYSYGETEDYLVNIIPSNACSGTPTPGNTLVELPSACTSISNTYALCSGNVVNLSVQNISTNTGTTYQWYDNNGLISGATNAIYTSPILTSNQTYYCRVTCTNSGLYANSSIMTITMNSYLNCYCNSGAVSISDEEILNVNLNGITNPTTCLSPATGSGSILNRYSNFTNIGTFASAALGSTIPFSVSVDDCDTPPAPYYSFGTAIWIDFNHNGSFNDAGEQVFVESAAISGPRTVTGNINIPCTAIQGITRIRITAAEGISGTALTPCLSYNFGETEDYLINLIPASTAVNYNFGTTASSTISTTTPINTNLTVSAISQGNNANTAQSSIHIVNTNTSNYSGASAQMNAGITARNRNLQLTDSSAYFQVVLTPASGYQVVLDSVFLGSKSLSTGPTTLDIRTSANNYLTSAGSFTVTATSSWNHYTIGLSPVTSNTPLTIRIYGYVPGGSGSVTTGTTAANWFIDDLKLKVRTKCLPVCNLTATAISSPILCNGGTSNLTASYTNGNGVIYYKLNNGVSQTSNIFPNLAAGTYTVTITEENLCTASTVKVITQPNVLSSNTTISACNSYTSPYSGITYTTSGVYITNSLSADGCPRTDTLNLTLGYSVNSATQNVTACNSYTWNGSTYTSSGTYVYTNLNASGCMNTQTLSLVILTNTTTTAAACNSYNWTVNNITYTSSGTYTHTTGCQVSTLQLTITSSTNNNSTISACSSYLWSVNNTTYTTSGTYTHTNGCQTSTLNLTISPNTTSSTNATACGSYLWTANNTTYTASGTYTHVSSCHTTTLNLTINPNTSTSSTVSACGSYLWTANNTTYTASGTYTTVSGCQTSTLNLTITPNTSSTNTVSSCGSYLWTVNNTTYTASGVYTNTTSCHASTLNLTITPNTSNSNTVSACGSYLWTANNTTYTASGTYTSVSGCQTSTLNLTITPNTSSTNTVSACGSYLWTVNNTTYTASGVYTNTTSCHASTLNLTITPNTSNANTVSACGSYLWTANNTTYTASGTYTSVSGCQTSTLNLTITPNTSSTNTVSACGSYLWSVNNTTYTASGAYTHTSSCHTSTLNLTITPNTTNSNTVSACGSYLWTANNTTYTTSGTYTSTTGCQTSTLNLTITPNTSSTNTVSACGSYLWTVNNTSYTTSGVYNAVSGCHTSTLNLTITPYTTFDTTVSACGSYTWPVNSITYTASGSYTATVGCQTKVLHLNMVANTSNTTTISACNSYLWSVNNTSYTASGTYSSVSGCQTSILNLTISSNTTSSLTVSSCGSYTWPANNITYTATGTYTNVTGCNTATLNLTITPISNPSSTVSVCGSYLWSVNNATYTSSGTYTHTVGCVNSTLNLTITSNTSSSTSMTACGSYIWNTNNVTYTASGVYTSTSGCHSSTLNLTINPVSNPTSNVTVCGSYLWNVNNVTYTNSGVYTHTIGCNNYTLNLTVNANTTTSTNIAACNSYTWPANNVTYTNSGTYTFISGCNTSTLNLTINASTTSSSTINACGSYTWPANNITYTTSGTYTNVGGCNSATLNLTITPNSSNSNSISACGSYTWPANNITYTASGVFTHLSVCQTSTLNLTITANTNSTNVVSSCGSYTWPINNVTYTASGIYNSVSGCHTNILNLTITQFTNTTNSITACNSYTWPVNNLTYTTTGNYTSVSGCHTSNLNLVINNSTNSTQSVTTTGSYFWNVSGTTYASSGTYTYTSLNAAGCQHTSTLNLSISTPLTFSVIENQPISCHGNNDGSAIASANGTQPISFRIDGGPFNNTTGYFPGITPGMHTFCVKDGNGNILCDSLYYLEPDPLSVTFTIDSVVSCLGNDGMITANILGGTNLLQGYLTWWTNAAGDTINDLLSNNFALNMMQLSAGTYQVAIEDDNGCFISGTQVLAPASSVIANAIFAPITCIGGTTSLLPSASGGVPYGPYTYLVNGTSVASSYPAGTYTVTAIDALGCSGSTIVQIPAPTVFSSTVNITSCGSYTWPLDGQVYTVSGTFNHVNGCFTTTLNLTINPCATTLNIKVFLEGYYNGNSEMIPVLMNEFVSTNPLITDTIEVRLYDANSPFNLAFSTMSVLNTDGTASCIFPPLSGSYYIGVRHRNSLLTWSANPVLFNNSPVNYDFTNAASKAYGNNMKEIENGIWAIYTGDIFFDENIDLLDYSLLELSISNFDFGYVATDLNGDGNVDLLDNVVIQENLNNFIYTIHP